MSLKEYKRKRKFDKTPEPQGSAPRAKGPLRFVVHLHAATQKHFDLRLEAGGVFKSWAVPKGPSLNPLDQRLAVFVEDHPLDYGKFEGVIPKGNYGAGTVMIWDTGHYVERTASDRAKGEAKVLAGLESGKITFVLSGKRLSGEFALIQTNKQNPKNWLLVKKQDGHAHYVPMVVDEVSAATGRNFEEIEREAPSKGEVWLPKRTRSRKKKAKLNLREATVAKPVKEKIPRKIFPMLPTQRETLPDSKDWVFEAFGTGFRSIAECDNNRVQLYSKTGISFNRKYPEIVDALKGKGSFVLDGEILLRVDGKEASREALRAYKKGDKGDLVYRVLDLLHLDGTNTRVYPLEKRTLFLKKLNIYSDSVELVEGFKEAPEGGRIIARYLKSPYESGVASEWTILNQTQLEGPRLTNTDKVYWPVEGYTKLDLIQYYESVAPILLPHLRDRAQSLHRHPNGIESESFFQKDVTGFLPPWVETTNVVSRSSEKTVQYLVCQNKETLLTLANMGCIELNPWISRIEAIDSPDYAVIDLDPDGNDFSEVIAVAQACHEILSAQGLESFCKTSGATGLHICIPCDREASYDLTREFSKAVCEEVHQRFPKFTSVERTPSKRRNKIYLDFLQNRRGQTLASVYCVRPRPGATVSTPLEWSEVQEGLNPAQFTIQTVGERISRKGDLWAPMLNTPQDLAAALEKLQNK